MNGIVYARNIKDRTLTFAVSGLLWENNLVMIDEETESLWSHLMGAAMKGPLEGEQLEIIPALMTDWENWRSSYPESSVAMMSKTSDFTRNNRQMREQMTIGIAIGGEERNWPFVFLIDNVANEVVGGHPVAVAYYEPTLTATVFDRRVGDQELTFSLNGSTGFIHDHETGSVWNICSGNAVSGPLQGKQLTRLQGVVADGLSWSTFHPKSVQGKRQYLPQIESNSGTVGPNVVSEPVEVEESASAGSAQ